MNLKQVLTSLAKVVVEEAQENPRFRTRLEAVLDKEKPRSPDHTHQKTHRSGPDAPKGGRRTPALLDPVELARTDSKDLRARLENLDLERLLDVVAQYGMDPGKLVMKWKSRARIIDRIMEISESRATKGDAFRGD